MSTPSSTRPAIRFTVPAWPASSSLALLVLRIAIGAVFIAHGAQKIFFYGFAGTSAAFGDMGIPFPSVAGPLVGLVELIGGALLVIGLFSRVVGTALAGDMLVALLLVHLPFGIFANDGGYELPLVLAAGSLVVVLAGAGRMSVDAVLTARR